MTVTINGTTGIDKVQDGSVQLDDIASGALVETGGAVIGYGVDSGGVVTQLTSKGTTVTLNTPCGQVTMHAASLAASTAIEFSVLNSCMTDKSVVIVNAATTFANYRVEIRNCNPIQFIVRVTNLAAVPLAEAVVINFAIINGATS